MVTDIPRPALEVSPGVTFEAGTCQITADRMARMAGPTGTGPVTTVIPVTGTGIPVPGSAFRLDQAITDTATGIAVTGVTEVIEVSEVSEVITEVITQVITAVITKASITIVSTQESESSPATPSSRPAWLILIRFRYRRVRASQVGAFCGRGLIDAVPANGPLRSCFLEPV